MNRYLDKLRYLEFRLQYQDQPLDTFSWNAKKLEGPFYKLFNKINIKIIYLKHLLFTKININTNQKYWYLYSKPKNKHWTLTAGQARASDETFYKNAFVCRIVGFLLKNGIAIYWPGMHNTAFLVGFKDQRKWKSIWQYNLP